MLIIDAVRASGIDVSAWSNAKNPATNPKYCYEWGFINKAEDRVLLCLWFDDLVEDSLGILESGNVRELVAKLESEGHSAKARRARTLDQILMDCRRTHPSISVAIVDETDRRKANKSKGDTSKAAFRELDSQPWRLEFYDIDTGDYVLRRGAARAVQSVSAESFPDTSVSDDMPSQKQPTCDDQSGELSKDLHSLLERQDISTTTRTALIAARVGQGLFRERLLGLWSRACALSGCVEEKVLRASHIKPWRDCTDEERLDPANGLLLTANLDALFDACLISFSEQGQMLVSGKIATEAQQALGLSGSLKLPLNPAQQTYLSHHRARFQESR